MLAVLSELCVFWWFKLFWHFHCRCCCQEFCNEAFCLPSVRAFKFFVGEEFCVVRLGADLAATFLSAGCIATLLHYI